MPTATASTGARQLLPLRFRCSSRAITIAPTAAPIATMFQGRPEPKMPLATEAISVACGAASALTPSRAGVPMP